MPGPSMLAGVDGCKGGWIAVVERHGVQSSDVFQSFDVLIDALADDAIVAVDIPIGLPDRIGPDGRGPDMLVRSLLGPLKSSVFSIPSRKAVYASAEIYDLPGQWLAGHRLADTTARATSDPPRGVSIQAFGIFGKIREVDVALRSRTGLSERVIESHPEVAFWRLNGNTPLTTRKKLKGRVNSDAMDERSMLLMRDGIDADLLRQPLPSRAGRDDLLDAAAMLCIARRHARGATVSFPDRYQQDGHGLPIAIWA